MERGLLAPSPRLVAVEHVQEGSLGDLSYDSRIFNSLFFLLPNPPCGTRNTTMHSEAPIRTWPRTKDEMLTASTELTQPSTVCDEEKRTTKTTLDRERIYCRPLRTIP